MRKFEAGKTVSKQALKRIVDCGRWAPSGANAQCFDFIVVDDPAQKALLCEAGDFMTPVANAPAAICLVQEPEGYEFDTGRLAQNIMLAADAVGLATCPVTLHREEVAADVLALPDDRRCRYAIAIGYPGASAEPGRMGGRKPIADLVHRNRYDG